ncbi:fructose-1,6-bisphosphatase [Enterococcus sp. BWT-B8]|uniref:fructose-1,6-bisphosphatase n=1 Tax=Enterococcus sp. BWT-B8 TaxID=2885157 RepID=UPI001E55ED69|nr:fructose-1,6-bisphosphatase [Enterococcus sp. BWT-B8]MCB5950759.1 fructose-1,6-bisphosphatase [Enterococcus sp. BWT-B8]
MTRLTRNELIAEIINLEAILNLPKGTEHFVSDLHGEFEAFDHILRNGSGSIKEKVRIIFGKKLTDKEINSLCFLIYYPQEKLALLKEEQILTSDFWQQKIEQLLTIVRFCSCKYTRSKVRKALPENYAYILEELIYPYDEEADKEDYFKQIIEKIIDLQEAEFFVAALCELIQRLVVDHLHVIGDIYDRGPYPDKIMEKLINYHSVDIQFGNHDIIWLGAFCGSKACLANVLRISARYGNLDLVEDSYGINLESLRNFSRKHYTDNLHFQPKNNPYRQLSTEEKIDSMLIQQAMTIIQQKLEGQIIIRRPDFKMEGRLLLDKLEGNILKLNQKNYSTVNSCFQTVNMDFPYQLSNEEDQLMEDLSQQFKESKLLEKHMSFLVEKGSLYLNYNHNLLIHGCIPLNEDGTFQPIQFKKYTYSGKKLLDYFNQCILSAYHNRHSQIEELTDIIWYLWCGEGSSLFGKKAMKTFERYFLKEKETHAELKNPYYKLREDEQICMKLMKEFDADPALGSIINGHTPVKVMNGEAPIKANGKMLVIDGGFSKSYQKITGIGGYTLISNSYGMHLAAHKPFTKKEAAIRNSDDIVSSRQIIDRKNNRIKVRDTTIGQSLKEDALNLQKVLTKKQRKLE